MGIDKSLSDAYPSVIVNRVRYHYGRDREYGRYLVENAFVAKDYWSFKEEIDLRAWLVNAPDSADRDLRRRLHPDWAEVTPEQRDAFFEEDKLLFREWAEKKIKSGTAQRFDMLDLDGMKGPHIPQRIATPGRSPDEPHWVVGVWLGARPPFYWEQVWFRDDVMVPLVGAKIPEPGARPQYVIAEVLDPTYGTAVVVGATKNKEYLLYRRDQYERGLVPVQGPGMNRQVAPEQQIEPPQSRGTGLGQAEELLDRINRTEPQQRRRGRSL
jgi:hypothetical protein